VDTLATGLSHFHSYWRYLVLIAAVVAFAGALAGWLGKMPARKTARQAGLLYVIAIDVQVTLGIVLWLLRLAQLGGDYAAFPRPYRLEHPLIMILALVAIHVGTVMAKRAKSDAGSARIVAIAVAVSFILVLVGIPGLLPGR
jgi:hypothetical protein